MNITYSETQGESPFDWFEELSKPNISDRKWNELSWLSQSWITCACGNQCDIIPRDGDGVPKDNKLAQLGCRFHESIKDRKAKKAIEILHKIEARSAVLIKKQWWKFWV